MDLVMPLTVPVKVGLATGALQLRAFCVAVEIGLLASAVLSTLLSLTMDLVMPLTVPENNQIWQHIGICPHRYACRVYTHRQLTVQYRKKL